MMYKIEGEDLYIVDVFGTDGETDGVLADTGSFQCIIGQLRMSSRCRMDDKALHISHIG